MVLILHSIIAVLIMIELLELISSYPCSIFLTTLLLVRVVLARSVLLSILSVLWINSSSP